MEEEKISALNPEDQGRVEKDIEAIEKEKEEYEDGEDEEVEDKDVDVIEVDFSEDEINDWLSKLIELKENKGQITLEVDDENELLINYEESEEEEE